MKVHKFDGNAVHESAAFYNRDFTNGELIKLRLDENGKVQFPRSRQDNSPQEEQQDPAIILELIREAIAATPTHQLSEKASNVF